MDDRTLKKTYFRDDYDTSIFRKFRNISIGVAELTVPDPFSTTQLPKTVAFPDSNLVDCHVGLETTWEGWQGVASLERGRDMRQQKET